MLAFNVTLKDFSKKNVVKFQTHITRWRFCFPGFFGIGGWCAKRGETSSVGVVWFCVCFFAWDLHDVCDVTMLFCCSMLVFGCIVGAMFVIAMGFLKTTGFTG